MTKNFQIALTALMLFMVVLFAKSFTEPAYVFSVDETKLLLLAANDVNNWNEGKPPIRSVGCFIDGKNGIVNLKVYVDETASSEKFAEIEREIKRDFLRALTENFSPDALIKKQDNSLLLVMKMEVKIYLAG